MPITDARRLNILKQLKPKMTEEQTKQLEAFLDDASPVAQTFTEQFLAREDYSRQIQEATAAAKAAQAEQAKLTEKYSQLQTWETSAKLDLQRKEAQAASVAKRAVEQLNNLRSKAQADTLTVSDFAPDPLVAQFSTLSTDTVPPANQLPNQTVNTNPQQFQQPNLNPNQVRDAENQLVEGIAALFDLSSKHQRLFNTPLDTGSLIRQAQLSNKPITQVYDELFEPNVQEAKLAREAIRAELRTEVEAELKSKYSTLDPSLQSMDMGNMSKLIEATSSSALRFQGPGNDAAGLNKNFVPSAPPGQPPPGAPPAGTPPPNDSFDHRAEEAQWGKEFMDNLAAKL